MLKYIRMGVYLVCVGFATFVSAQELPVNKEQIATLGGDLVGNTTFKLEKIVDGFDDPVNVTIASDGSGRIFVVERRGKIRIITRDGEKKTEPFLDLTTLRPTAINPSGNVVLSEFIEQGLFSVAFHPEFTENGFFFVHYTSARDSGAGRIARFQVDAKSPDVVSTERARETEKLIMKISQPSYNNNGGEIAFGPDGYLYIGVGDGGFEAPSESSQELSTRLGKILRIDVDTDSAYSAPSTNPFASKGGTPQDEIWAVGLHNPYKFAFDGDNGGLFIADVGDSHWEEINYIAPDSGGGQNFGWPKMEGSQCAPIVDGAPEKECDFNGSLPIAQYQHPSKDAAPDPSTGGLACASVQGLGVANYPDLQGAYLFADWCSGDIHGVGWDGSSWQMETLLETDLHITAGGVDEDGSVLVLSAKFYFDDPNSDKPPFGTVWRLTPNSSGAETAPSSQTSLWRREEYP